MIANLLLSGELTLDCPYGSMEVDTNDKYEILVHFENGKVFRYFLSSIQLYFNPSLRSLGSLDYLQQSLSVKIGGKRILEKPQNGSAQLNYWKGGWQYLLWKIGF